MKKIATPQDLQAELRQLLAYSQGETPERGRIAAALTSMADRLAASDSKLEKALKGYLHHVKGTKPKYQPPKSLTEHVKRALAQGEDEQRKALKGIIHHNQGTKEEYQLPNSLMRQLQGVTASTKTAMDSDEEELYDAVWMIASNDGASYKKKDAKGAVSKAWREWQKLEGQRNRENWRSVEKQMVKDLTERWNKGEV